MTSRPTIAGRSLSSIVLGCEPLGGTDWGSVDTVMTASAVEAAVEGGITAFDVADVYGLGRAEELLGRVLAGKRSEVLLMSRGGVRWWASGDRRARTGIDGSPVYLRHAVHASLGRLRIERIPLYFLHGVDASVPIEESVGALSELNQAGKLGAIGLSHFGLSEIRRAHAVHPIAAVTFEYNLLKRDAEADLIPVCADLGIALLAHSPLAHGLLTGKYEPKSRFGSNDRRHRLPLFTELADGRLDGKLAALRAVAARHGATPAEVALRWVLARPGISAAIAGAKNPDQVHTNLGSLNLSLDARDCEALDFKVIEKR